MKKNGKYSNKGLNIKPLALLLALALLVGCAIGGTIAWLTSTTGEVENTFTIGDINISLVETETDEAGNKGYDFVPGDTLAKDPKVTVAANSEDCYLFVKVTSTNNSCGTVNSIVNWNVTTGENPATGWVTYNTDSTAGVTYYYRTVAKNANAQPFYILDGKHEADCADTTNCTCAFKNGYVTISSAVTKDMVATINNAKPKLTFAAAAVQTANIVADGAKTAVDVAFEQIVWPT